MAPRYLKDGEDFSFDPAFGFTESAKGRHDAMNHPTDPGDDDYGDGSYVEKKAAGGKIKVTPEQAGHIVEGARTLGALQAVKAVKDSVGRALAQRAAATPRAPAVKPIPAPAMPPAPMAATPPPSAPMPGPGPTPGMAKGGKVKGWAKGGKVQGYDIGGPVGATLTPQMPIAGGVNMPQQMQMRPPGMAEGGKFLQKAVKRPGRMKNLAERHGVSLGEEVAKDVHSKDPSLRGAAILAERFRSGEFKHKGKK